MNNKIFQTILEIPVFWRALIVLFVIWLLYIIFSRIIFKMLSLVPLLVSKIWLVLYLLFNNIMHCIHKLAGKTLISADQAVTDFFCCVYNFVCTIKSALEDFCFKEIPILDINGNQVLDINGTPQYNRVPRKPFAGYTFIISLLLVLWISIPTWLHIENKSNSFNAAYTTYIEIEKKVFEMIFLE